MSQAVQVPPEFQETEEMEEWEKKLENQREDILIPQGVISDYFRWKTFMEDEVEFWEVGGTWHTKPHCARVLLLSLLIGNEYHLPKKEINALAMASVFHDSRRKTEWYDVSHGQRAADYYREYCGTHPLPFDERTYLVMAGHDRKDEEWEAKIREELPDDRYVVFLYRIFKDADALDRFRLGKGGLDVNYIRTLKAKTMVLFAKHIWLATPEKVFEEQADRRRDRRRRARAVK